MPALSVLVAIFIGTGDVIKDRQRDLRESRAQDLGRLDSAFECCTEVLGDMMESVSFPTKVDALVVRRRHYRPHNPPGQTLLFECVFFRERVGKCDEFEGALYSLDHVKAWVANTRNKKPLVVCVPKIAAQPTDSILAASEMTYPTDMVYPGYLQLSQMTGMSMSQLSHLSQFQH